MLSPEKAKERYENHIMDFLNKVKSYAASRPHWTKIDDNSIFFEDGGEEYQWFFGAECYGVDVSVEFTIVERRVHEDNKSGLTFSLKADGKGGFPIDGCIPYNYSPFVWASTRAELEHRFEFIMTEIDPEFLVDTIEDWCESEQKKKQLTLNLEG